MNIDNINSDKAIIEFIDIEEIDNLMIAMTHDSAHRVNIDCIVVSAIVS